MADNKQSERGLWTTDSVVGIGRYGTRNRSRDVNEIWKVHPPIGVLGLVWQGGLHAVQERDYTLHLS